MIRIVRELQYAWLPWVPRFWQFIVTFTEPLYWPSNAIDSIGCVCVTTFVLNFRTYWLQMYMQMLPRLFILTRINYWIKFISLLSAACTPYTHWYLDYAADVFRFLQHMDDTLHRWSWKWHVLSTEGRLLHTAFSPPPHLCQVMWCKLPETVNMQFWNITAADKTYFWIRTKTLAYSDSFLPGLRLIQTRLRMPGAFSCNRWGSCLLKTSHGF